MNAATKSAPDSLPLIQQLGELPADQFKIVLEGAKARRALTDAPAVAYLEFDFDAPAPAPSYVVRGVFEAETVNVLSGDTGAAKSILAQELTAAAVTGRPWLGRDVLTDRVLYIDEENPRIVPTARLRALGVENSHRDRLRYVNRAGVELGTDRWDAWLRTEIEAHRPGLVLVDTAMAATAADVNENDSVVSLYKALRPIASETGAAIVLLHHERKQQVGQTRDRSQAMLGARQWAGQADRQLTVRVNGHLEVTDRPDGGADKRREFVLEGGKDRMGESGHPELIVVSSVTGPTGALQSMTVTSEGAVTPERSRKDQLADEIVEALRDAGRPMQTAELAEAVAEDADDGTFKAALRVCIAEDRPRVSKVRKGLYARTDAGREGGGGLPID
jgi:hypothetical protein